METLKKNRRMTPRRRTHSYHGNENARTIQIRNQFYSDNFFQQSNKPPSSLKPGPRPSPPRHKTAASTGVRHKDRRTRSGSLSSNNSSSNSKNSILTPKFLPWAFGNDVSSRIFPLGVEEPRRGSSLLRPIETINPNGNNSAPHGFDDGKQLRGGLRKNMNVYGIPTNRSDPEIRRYRSHKNDSLKYNTHSADDDLSVSSASGNNASLNELHMDAIFNEFSPLTNPMHRKGNGHMHERSRSADCFVDRRGPLYSNFGREQNTAPIKSPPGYGAADEDPGYNDDDLSFDDGYGQMEVSPFLVRNEGANFTGRSLISNLDGDKDPLDDFHGGKRRNRSLRHRVFLLLTDPTSSILSSLCFVIVAFMILCSNIALIVQTLDKFEYNPSECNFCDDYGAEIKTDDTTAKDTSEPWVECICPPRPIPYIVRLEDYIMYFFTVEWVLRVICYDPPLIDGERRYRNPIRLMFEYATEPLTILDLLAFLPYYLEKIEINGGTSYASWEDKTTGGNVGVQVTPIFRIFRVFQLIRLGQYNSTFCALVNVLGAAISSLNILVIVLIFSAAFFGSIIYWLERGSWMYTELMDPPGFAHVREASDGLTHELSPFRSIPSSCWWFMVTATTVGYGDIYPTSPAGKAIAALAMLLGVLVIAFPVSVFSELWSKELKAVGAFESVKESIKENIRAIDGETPPKVISARVDKRSIGIKGGNFIDNELSFSPETKPDGTLNSNDLMSMSDVQAVRHYMSVIDDAQSKIRIFLEKIESTAS